MLSIFLFIFTLIFTAWRIAAKKRQSYVKRAEIFLSYLFFFNVGLMGIAAAYAHVFMGPETAHLIGWQPSPFQFEMGMTNLGFGVLGILAYWVRDRFWEATVIAWSVILLGCFVGHINDYVVNGNSAPYNIGVFVWFNDLILPFILIGTLTYIRQHQKNS